MKGTAKYLIDLATRVCSRQESNKAVRALLRNLGGQLVYFPTIDKKGKAWNLFFGLLADELPEIVANKVMLEWVAMFGGCQIYFPVEHLAFRDEVAIEIYERYNGTMDVMGDLCRKYNISFMQVYRLREHGLKLIMNRKDDLFA